MIAEDDSDNIVIDPFEEDSLDYGAPDAERLLIDIEGFEGPIDMLLVLARNQKVDLTRISILALAEQYLEFIAQAHPRQTRFMPWFAQVRLNRQCSHSRMIQNHFIFDLQPKSELE